jgi:hypothetical protein
MKILIKQNIILATLLLFPGAVVLADPPPAAPKEWTIAIENGRFRSGDFVPQGHEEATLGNAVAVLRRAYPSANIVLEPGLEKILIGDVVVHGSEPDLDLEAFSVASGRQFFVESHSSPYSSPGNVPTPYMPMPPAVGGGGKHEVLLVVKKSQPPPAPKPEIKVEAFNLSSFIANKTSSMKEEERQKIIDLQLDRLESTIARILHGIGETSLPEFYFYREADLLVVTGSDKAVEVARKIISSLPGQDFMRTAYPGPGFLLPTKPSPPHPTQP